MNARGETERDYYGMAIYAKILGMVGGSEIEGAEPFPVIRMRTPARSLILNTQLSGNEIFGALNPFLAGSAAGLNNPTHCLSAN